MPPLRRTLIARVPGSRRPPPPKASTLKPVTIRARTILAIWRSTSRGRFYRDDCSGPILNLDAGRFLPSLLVRKARQNRIRRGFEPTSQALVTQWE